MPKGWFPPMGTKVKYICTASNQSGKKRGHEEEEEDDDDAVERKKKKKNVVCKWQRMKSVSV